MLSGPANNWTLIMPSLPDQGVIVRILVSDKVIRSCQSLRWIRLDKKAFVRRKHKTDETSHYPEV